MRQIVAEFFLSLRAHGDSEIWGDDRSYFAAFKVALRT
jgi:hypothetical protein